jgi:hypothetical protein
MRTTDIAAAAPPAGAPRLAEGVELIGEFEGSGFKEPPLLARRADGQVVQLTQLLYLVAEACDGVRDLDAVADAVSERYGRRVSGENVAFLVDEKLRPLGVLALADGSTPELDKRPALLALRHRRPVLSETATNRAAAALTWLHAPVVQIPLLLAVAAFDVWLFGIHGVAGGLRSALYAPGLLLAVLGSVVVATAFHELGHASACRYGGARPACWASASTSCGRRSTATSPTPTGSTARGGCGPTSAASTSTRSSRCCAAGCTRSRARRPRCSPRSCSTCCCSSSCCRCCASTATTSSATSRACRTSSRASSRSSARS